MAILRIENMYVNIKNFHFTNYLCNFGTVKVIKILENLKILNKTRLNSKLGSSQQAFEVVGIEF